MDTYFLLLPGGFLLLGADAAARARASPGDGGPGDGRERGEAVGGARGLLGGGAGDGSPGLLLPLLLGHDASGSGRGDAAGLWGESLGVRFSSTFIACYAILKRILLVIIATDVTEEKATWAEVVLLGWERTGA